MTDGERKDIGAIIRDGTAIDRAIEAARRRTFIRHKQLGIPLVIWQDERVVEIAPEDIVVPEEDPDPLGDPGDRS